MRKKPEVVSLVEVYALAVKSALEVDDFCLKRLGKIEALPQTIALLNSWVEEEDVDGVFILTEVFCSKSVFAPPPRTAPELLDRTNAVIEELKWVVNRDELSNGRKIYLQEFLIQLSSAASCYCQRRR